jgi:hypothetical protein
MNGTVEWRDRPWALRRVLSWLTAVTTALVGVGPGIGLADPRATPTPAEAPPTRAAPPTPISCSSAKAIVQADYTWIRYDAVTNTAALFDGALGPPLVKGEAFRARKPVCITVVGANTAYQDVSVTAERIDTTNWRQAVGFYTDRLSTQFVIPALANAVQKLGPPPLPALPRTRGPALMASLDRMKRTAEKVGELSEVVTRARAAALVAAAMMAETPDATEGLAVGLERRLLTDGLDCTDTASPRTCRLPATRELIETYAQLDRDLNDFIILLQREPLDAGTEAEAEAWSAKALQILSGMPDAIANTRGTDMAVQRVTTAVSSRSWGPYDPSATTGFLVSISVAPTSAPWLSDIAPRGARAYSIQIESRGGFRVAIGAGIQVVPNGLTPQYGVENGKVAVTGYTDYTVMPAIALGFGLGALDWRPSGGPALWIPEVIVPFPPSGGLAIGVGVAATWSYFRVSAGAVWLKQYFLATQSLGDPTTDKTVSTSQGFGAAPRFYFSLGIGFPP